MLLRDVGEFGFIDRVAEMLATDDGRVVKGIGDDCAVIDLGNGQVQVVTTDALVENVHFLVDRTTPHQLGHKSLAVSLSDVAAMGAEPEFAVATIASPADRNAQYLLDTMAGMRALADRFNVRIVGGDMTQSEERLMISVTVFGRGRRDCIVYRDGARPGDAVIAVGVLGESGAGLATILRDVSVPSDVLQTLRTRHLAPEPLVEEGRLLATLDGITAMMDVSDGIASDVRHICTASTAASGQPVGVRIDESSLPVTTPLAKFLDATGEAPVRYLLQSGEDYALLACVRADRAEHVISEFRAQFDTPIVRIGEITGGGHCILRRGDGSEVPLTGGHDHFGTSAGRT